MNQYCESYEEHTFEFKGKEKKIFINETFQGKWLLSAWKLPDVEYKFNTIESKQYANCSKEAAIERFKRDVFQV